MIDWIRVEDEPPKKDDVYLTFGCDPACDLVAERGMNFTRFRNGKWYWSVLDIEFMGVTHYTLPEPPHD